MTVMRRIGDRGGIESKVPAENGTVFRRGAHGSMLCRGKPEILVRGLFDGATRTFLRVLTGRMPGVTATKHERGRPGDRAARLRKGRFRRWMNFYAGFPVNRGNRATTPVKSKTFRAPLLVNTVSNEFEPAGR